MPAFGEIERQCVDGSLPEPEKAGLAADQVAPDDLLIRTALDVGFMQNEVMEPAATCGAGSDLWRRIMRRTQPFDGIDQLASQPIGAVERGRPLCDSLEYVEKATATEGEPVQAPQRALDGRSQLDRECLNWRQHHARPAARRARVFLQLAVHLLEQLVERVHDLRGRTCGIGLE